MKSRLGPQQGRASDVKLLTDIWHGLSARVFSRHARNPVPHTDRTGRYRLARERDIHRAKRAGRNDVPAHRPVNAAPARLPICRDKGRPRAPSQGYADYVGLSVFDSEEIVLANATRFPAVIAAVRLEHAHGFDLARTYADIAGHHTVWGEPSDLLEQVEAVLRHEAPE